MPFAVRAAPNDTLYNELNYIYLGRIELTLVTVLAPS